MQMHDLAPHSAHPPRAIATVKAGCAADDQWLRLRWRIEPAATVGAPPFAGKQRRDELWRTTCFELFVASEGGAYAEFNLSPSDQWAAYDFSGYRARMRERAMPRAPVCTWRAGGAFAIFDAAIPWPCLPQGYGHAALAAVIEEVGGCKSFWALSHPVPQKPDFHHHGGFALPWPPLRD